MADWKISLASRNNILFCDIPYIPILLEDIPKYVSEKDFKKNRIKKIQTFGKLIPQNEISAELESLRNACKFPISFKNLNISHIYINNSSENRNGFCAIWQKYDVFRVYGTLEDYGTLKEESGHILQVDRLLPVNDIEGTWRWMNVVSKLARSEYRRYYRTKAQNERLFLQYDDMKEKRKRYEEEKRK